MTKQMLIDAAHPGETRVAVLANGALEEFDVETEQKRQLKGIRDEAAKIKGQSAS